MEKTSSKLKAAVKGAGEMGGTQGTSSGQHPFMWPLHILFLFKDCLLKYSEVKFAYAAKEAIINKLQSNPAP